MRCGNNQTCCNCECIIAPINTVLKSLSGKVYGIWQCPKCGWHSLDIFPSDKDITKYIAKKESNEK